MNIFIIQSRSRNEGTLSNSIALQMYIVATTVDFHSKKMLVVRDDHLNLTGATALEL
jgi:hypothetical protein